MPLAEKTVLPPGASVPGMSGPTIGGFRLESVPTLPPLADEWMKQAPPNRCIVPGCSGKLAVFRGVVALPAAAGSANRLEDSDRCKRQSYVACERCRTPVPVTHPRQVALDQEWQALEAKEKAEAERLAKLRALSPPAPVQAINPAVTLDALAQSAFDEAARLRRDHQALQQRVAALERKASDGTPF
jgi:hypothetical protein